MQPVNPNNFIAGQLLHESVSIPKSPFYIVYTNPNMLLKNDYPNFFQKSNPNFDFLSQDVQKSLIQGRYMFQGPFLLQSKQISVVQINASQNNQQAPSLKATSQPLTKEQKTQVFDKAFKEQHQFANEESSFEVRSHKLSESKNIPKNYEKAILIYIKKNISYTSKVLQHCNVDFEDFMGSLKKVGKNLGSIAKLRSLWMDSENRFAKVFRIISKEYLRKHALSYIFNSRVVNITKHVKYRQIIEEGIAKPECFTHMKEY